MAGVNKFDLIVIGAGPGGYVACLRAAELGMSVACVERDSRLGGVCLTVGCIPSKALLDSSEYYHLLGNRFAEHGVLADGVKLELSAMMARKEKVVEGLTGNVQKLMDGAGVRVYRGSGALLGEGRVEVRSREDGATGSGRTILEAKNILLASGSEPVFPSGLSYDGMKIVSSTEALAFDSVPRRLGVIGAGYIGLELGSVWRRLGAETTFLELAPGIATSLDGQASRALQRILTRQGLVFRLETRVTAASASSKGVRVSLLSGGKEEEMEFDKLLVAVGRKPLTRGLGLDEAGVAADPRSGFVRVDAGYRTSVPSIYAIGDLIGGPMLAHKASAEGVAAVEGMAGLSSEVNYDAIPSVIYTSPEAASVGLTEEQLKERGVQYRVGTYPLAGSARARCLGESEGFVKIIAHARSERILGVHIIATRASEMIAECVLAMEVNATVDVLTRASHGHPTFSEAVREAALALKSRSPQAG